MKTLIFVLAATSVLAQASAGEWLFRSAPGGTSLLELYSSEGCSSCPSADRYLASLLDQPELLWKDFVPVAFHVDYWDYLGWPDVLASHEYSDRQQSYGRLVTPELLLNGRPLRVLRKPASDTGTLTLRSQGPLRHSVAFSPTGKGGDGLIAHVALLGFGVSSEVKRGENRGATLHHEFVVLGHAAAPLSSGLAELTLKQNPAVAVKSLGVAAWISRGNDPTPIQAAGGFLSER